MRRGVIVDGQRPTVPHRGPYGRGGRAFCGCLFGNGGHRAGRGGDLGDGAARRLRVNHAGNVR